MVGRILCGLVAFLMIPAVAAEAREYRHAETGVSVTIAGDWDVEVEDGMIAASTKDETVGLLFVGVPAKDLKEALAEMTKGISESVTGFKTKGDREDIEINGLKGVMGDGEGKVEGEDVEVGFMLFAAPKKGMFLLALGIAKDGGAEKHGAAVKAVLESLKPTGR